MSDLPSYEDVLGMLAAKAGDGSVSAMIALERALRGERERDDDVDELEELLQGK
jgi:hypothetical protein